MFTGHRYGNTLVPMTDDDKQNMKYKAEKCFKVLGFTKAENVCVNLDFNIYFCMFGVFIGKSATLCVIAKESESDLLLIPFKCKIP